MSNEQRTWEKQQLAKAINQIEQIIEALPFKATSMVMLARHRDEGAPVSVSQMFKGGKMDIMQFHGIINHNMHDMGIKPAELMSFALMDALTGGIESEEIADVLDGADDASIAMPSALADLLKDMKKDGDQG